MTLKCKDIYGAKFDAEMKCYLADCNLNNPLCGASVAWLAANQVCINDLQLPVDLPSACETGTIDQTVEKTAAQKVKDKKRAAALGKLK